MENTVLNASCKNVWSVPEIEIYKFSDFPNTSSGSSIFSAKNTCTTSVALKKMSCFKACLSAEQTFIKWYTRLPPHTLDDIGFTAARQLALQVPLQIYEQDPEPHGHMFQNDTLMHKILFKAQ